MLPEAVFWEAADAHIGSGHSPGLKLKLHALYQRHGRQLFVGRNPIDIATSEFAHAGGTFFSIEHVVHHSETIAMRNIAELSADEFLAGLSRIPGNWGPLLDTKKRFDGLRPAFTAKAIELDAGCVRRLSGNPHELRTEIRKPTAIHGYAKWRITNTVPADWEPFLWEFPDRAAFGRWMRLELWYVLRGLNANISDNDFEDMMYAFAASYCGVLVSSDIGLKTACADVLPHVRVVGTPHELSDLATL